MFTKIDWSWSKKPEKPSPVSKNHWKITPTKDLNLPRHRHTDAHFSFQPRATIP